MPTPKFKPGQSGNPAGRPKDKTPATLLRKAIADDMPDVVRKLVELAKEGDVQAAKVLLDRICPPLRPQAIPVTVEKGATLPESGGNVVAATLSGEIPPDIGAMLIRALAEQGKLIELQEMADRLQRLEKLLEART
ncbi:DUF5681 domain-containing protein [Methylomonas sp. UP202]|uniref:DUF5681 domain-containing protein n=1 Tax=Methylomonas sp. UP202 TaxID=3040943 RepID=UPI0024783469|nr:DUF5681 domain-containing protein [Methylomonas sp. UP202]WGS85832.1 DUF5681 domain-containing protein [Methylomonas sp. UP202]